jgi:hypothetical protein
MISLPSWLYVPCRGHRMQCNYCCLMLTQKIADVAEPRRARLPAHSFLHICMAAVIQNATQDGTRGTQRQPRRAGQLKQTPSTQTHHLLE